MEGGSRNIFDDTSQEIDSMDNTTLGGDSRLGDVGVAGLNCIRVEGGLSILIDYIIEVLVVEGGTNIETLTRAEYPQLMVVGIGVDDNTTT